MSKYFHVSHGLRGCYMPDSVYVVRVETRRDLKAVLTDEISHVKQPGGCGGSRKTIARVAAAAWREAKKQAPSYLDFVVPVSDSRDRSSPSFGSYGVFCSVATRREYVESQKESES